MSEMSGDRAVSEVLGYILIFAMIVVAIGFVSIAGFAGLEDARDAEQHNNAERAFDVLANNLEDIYEHGAPSRATELSLGGSQLYIDDEVGLRVLVDGTTEVDTTIRPLVFQGSGDVEFVYEGGAVFRTQRSGGFMVRDPPLHLESDRMIFSVVRTESPNVQSIGGPSVLVRTTAQARNVTVRSSGGHDVTIELTGSPRRAAWQRHLEEDLGMSCSVSGDTLRCEDDGINPDRVLVTVSDIQVRLET